MWYTDKLTVWFIALIASSAASFVSKVINPYPLDFLVPFISSFSRTIKAKESAQSLALHTKIHLISSLIFKDI